MDFLILYLNVASGKHTFTFQLLAFDLKMYIRLYFYRTITKNIYNI